MNEKKNCSISFSQTAQTPQMLLAECDMIEKLGQVREREKKKKRSKAMTKRKNGILPSFLLLSRLPVTGKLLHCVFVGTRM